MGPIQNRRQYKKLGDDPSVCPILGDTTIRNPLI